MCTSIRMRAAHIACRGESRRGPTDRQADGPSDSRDIIAPPSIVVQTAATSLTYTQFPLAGFYYTTNIEMFACSARRPTDKRKSTCRAHLWRACAFWRGECFMCGFFSSRRILSKRRTIVALWRHWLRSLRQVAWRAEQ